MGVRDQLPDPPGISITKRKIMKCLLFADQFIDIIRRESYDVVEITVVFDRYDDRSLKAKIRSKRTKCISVRKLGI